MLRRDTRVMLDEGQNVELFLADEGRVVHVFDGASEQRLTGVQHVADGGRSTWEAFTTARRRILWSDAAGCSRLRRTWLHAREGRLIIGGADHAPSCNARGTA